jgi:hypothetical protein
MVYFEGNGYFYTNERDLNLLFNRKNYGAFRRNR